MKVEDGSATFVLPAAFDYYDPAATPDRRFFERVLWPVSISGPGAFGSQWQTDAALFNGNATALHEVGGMFAVPPLAATITNRSDGSSGLVDWIARTDLRNVGASLVIRDRSRDASDFGTSISVVRQADFYDRPFSIVNVPSDSRYRVSLRLYSYDGAPSLDVTLATVDGSVQSTRTVALQTVAAGTHSFAYVADLIPAELLGKGPLVVHVSGATAATPAWGFVSVTNNDTQHVTVVQPE